MPLLCFSFFIKNGQAQHKPGNVDMAYIANYLEKEFEVDTMLAVAVDSCTQLTNNWKKEFSHRLGGYTNACYRSEERLEKLKQEETALVSFYNYTQDTLPHLKEEIMQRLMKVVQEKVKHYGKQNGYSLIFDQSDVLYLNLQLTLPKKCYPIYYRTMASFLMPLLTLTK